MDRKPRILLTNDDGIDAPGIQKLASALSKKWDIYIAAPEKQKSAVSNALNISNPLRVLERPSNGICKCYSINGTPADCVKLALTTLLDFRPNLIISGINHGQNTAINILYSGTVAGATEGMLFGVPSIAASVASHDYSADLEASIEYVELIAEKVIGSTLPPDTLLNVNIPSIPRESIKGIKITRQSSNTWKDKYEQRNDPFGRIYYWFAGSFADKDESPESDDFALKEGYVSITPLEVNFTSFKSIENIKSVFSF